MSNTIQIVLGISFSITVLLGMSVYLSIVDAFYKESPFVIMGNRGRRKSFIERLLDGLGF